MGSSPDQAEADRLSVRAHGMAGYLVAVGAIAAAILVRLLLNVIVGPIAPFSTFVLAVLVAAWYGGLGPGLLATTLGSILGYVLMDDPVEAQVATPHFMIPVIFGIIGLTASLLSGELHRARERAEAKKRELSQARAQFTAIFNQSGIFAGIMDLKGTLREVNDLALHACGYSREEVINRPFWETPWWRGSADMQARIRTAWRQAAGGDVFRELLHYWLADGTERIVDFAMHPIRDADGRVIFLHPTGIDITERRQAEEALRDANRRKDEFLATLAHELRNPLAPLRNGLQIMRLAANDAAAVEQAREMMDRQLVHMVRLIDDLLDISRINRGKIDLRRGRVELRQVLQQAVETSRPAIEKARHELIVLTPPEPLYVDADITRLAQVFANLLNNAAKYSEPGGRITFAAERQGSQAVIRVRDTGVGIPPEMLPRVFDIFTQVDRSIEKSEGGLGIGLSLVKGLVELHGGTVEATSEGPGRGSEFLVRLPLAATPLPTSTSEAASSDLVVRITRRRVLVVDDNHDAATSLATMLQLMGNEAQTAHDGLEALTQAESFRPDLVMLDLGMPRLNGYDTARRLRAQPGGDAVMLVALTGWSQEDAKRRSEASGFDAHLTKPIELTALHALLTQPKVNGGGGV